jgi:hypothetical protein
LADRSAFSDEFLNVVRNLVAYFVQRQQLVFLAMLEVHPIVLGRGRISDIDILPYLETYHTKLRQIRDNAADRSQYQEEYGKLFKGVWKNDWNILRHGAGCRLTNIGTKEPLEWDAPDPQAIRLDWFLNHLNWRFKNEPDDPFIRQCLQWLENKNTDLKTITKALYDLIDREVLFLKQNHTCVLVNVHHQFTNKIEEDIPPEVREAALELVQHYWQRQQIVIAAMTDLRPDIIKKRSEEEFISPDVASRLRGLYQNVTSIKKDAFFQEGNWGDDEWHYNIGNVRCDLSHHITNEPFSWATSDPTASDFHGFRTHLIWQLKQQPEDQDVSRCLQWIDMYLQNNHPTLSSDDETGLATGTFSLLDILINRKTILLKRDEYGLLIK